MKIAILGCGVMGSAFARQIAKSGHTIVLCDRNQSRGEELANELGATFIVDPKLSVKGVDIIFLAIKPKDLKELAKKIGPLDGQVLFSMLAGTSVDVLKEHFINGSIVRGMPNLALKHGESVIALVEDESLSKTTIEKMNQILEGMGLVFWTKEDQLDAITALAGSGPAFVIAIIESMVDAGIMMGLRPAKAQELVLQTLLGAVALVKNHPSHPGDVRWQICAPKGTTIAGMHTFEEEGVRAGIMNTFLATLKKTKEML